MIFIINMASVITGKSVFVIRKLDILIIVISPGFGCAVVFGI